MRVAEVNEELIGKRVKCVCGGFDRTGVITALCEDKYSKGVHIKLDEPVFFSQGYGVQHVEWWEHEFDSTGRKFDDWGNLQHTELI